MQPLYDLSPAARLMLMGVLLAMGPLAWVWLRNRHQPVARRLAALTALTLFLTFDLVLFGAFTRLTDSGLGCPDWPGCYGAASPLGAQGQIGQAQAAMPTGPVTHTKAWIEMTHRYLATGVGVLILTLAAASWARRRELPVSPWWPTLTLLWVCVQGAFGALTVTMKLTPAIVTLHLLGGMVLLALLVRQAMAYRQPDAQVSVRTVQASEAEHSGHSVRAVRTVPAVHTVAPTLRAGLVGGFALLWLQIALGGWVSTNYAVLVCDTFPSCQGSWWPEMDFRQAFELWRPLGRTGDGEFLGLSALTAIHYTHRLMAYLLLPVLAALAWALHGAGLRKHGATLGLLALWQLASGLSNVVLGWPLVAAVSHTGGAAALVVAFTWVLCATTRGATSNPVPHAREGRASNPLPLAGEGRVRVAARMPSPSPTNGTRGKAA